MAEGCDAAPRLTSAAFGAFCDANSSCTLVRVPAVRCARTCCSLLMAELLWSCLEDWHRNLYALACKC